MRSLQGQSDQSVTYPYEQYCQIRTSTVPQVRFSSSDPLVKLDPANRQSRDYNSTRRTSAPKGCVVESKKYRSIFLRMSLSLAFSRVIASASGLGSIETATFR